MIKNALSYSYAIFIFVFLSFNSCQVTKEQNVKSEIAEPEFFAQFENSRLPFQSDSAFLNMNEFRDSLSIENFTLLSNNLSEQTDRYAYFEEFYKIDSLKKSGKYEEYVGQLDLAQVLDVNAHPLQKFKQNDQTLLLWVLSFESYPACPFYSGNHFYLSVFENNEFKKTIFVGQSSSMGDAPMYFAESQNFTISEDGSIKVEYTSENSDDGDEVATKKRKSKLSWK